MSGSNGHVTNDVTCGHVTNDVTCHLGVKLVTQLFLTLNISATVRDRDISLKVLQKVSSTENCTIHGLKLTIACHEAVDITFPSVCV